MSKKQGARSSVLLTLATSFAVMALLTGCSSSMMGDDLSSGDQKLRSGIALARDGIGRYQSGNASEGLRSVEEGRGMMGEGVGMMGGASVRIGHPLVASDDIR